MDDEFCCRSHGRRLLQQVTLVAVLMDNLRPDSGEIADAEHDLQAELERSYERARNDFATLSGLRLLLFRTLLSLSPYELWHARSDQIRETTAQNIS